MVGSRFMVAIDFDTFCNVVTFMGVLRRVASQFGGW